MSRGFSSPTTEADHPAVSSSDLKQLKLKSFLASKADAHSQAAVPNAAPSSRGLAPAAGLQSLKPVLKTVLSSLISENSSVAAWSKAALQFDTAFGRSASQSSLEKVEDESAGALDLGTRLAVSSNNERRLQNQLAASIAEIAELRSSSRQSSDISLARENQELRLQLAAAQRVRVQSASQVENHLQSKCSSLESENEMLESKCRRLQLEIQRMNDKTSLPANFWEGQHSVLNEIFDLKKEYEDLLSAHTSMRSEVKSLVEEKNNLLAQLSNKEHEYGTMSADLKSCKLRIARLEFELRSRSSESFNDIDSFARSSAAPFASSPQLEPFVPINRSAAAPWASSVSPNMVTSGVGLPSRIVSTTPPDMRPTSPLSIIAESSQFIPQRAVLSVSSHSPSLAGEVVELPLQDRSSPQSSQPYSQKMKAVLELVSTLDSRLLSLDTM